VKLPEKFFFNEDVVSISRSLLGKVLCTNINGIETSGVIQETEAYNGVIDKASHAFGGRFTERTKVMYEKGGIAYIYLCYGIHHLFNVVTNVEGHPHAVLIRGLIPLKGQETMTHRTQNKSLKLDGPGKLTKALGIDISQNRANLSGSEIWIEDRSIDITADTISVTPRIGINYAEEDIALPYRFVWDFSNYPEFLL